MIDRTFDAKQCERVRRNLDAYLSNELLVETTSEILRHLETCEACRANSQPGRACATRCECRGHPGTAPGVALAIQRRLRDQQPGFWDFPPCCDG